MMLLLLLLSAAWMHPSAWRLLACEASIFITECMLGILTVLPRAPRHKPMAYRLLLAAIGILPALAQVGICSCSRGQYRCICIS